MAMIKRENSYHSQSLVHEVLHAQSVLVLQKDVFQNTDLFSLKMSAYAKKNWHTFFETIFQVSADEGIGK